MYEYINIYVKKYDYVCTNARTLYVNQIISPFGKILFFLVHVMFGVGFPLAEHSRRTGDPFFTWIRPPDVT